MSGFRKTPPCMQPLLQAPAPVPTFVRLLAEVLDAQAHQPPRAFYQALEQWLDWTRAVRLSRVLDTVPAAGLGAASWHKQELVAACARARQRLREQVIAAPAWDAAMDTTMDTQAQASEAAFAPVRQHYVAFQRALQASTGQLRGQLRDALAQGDAGCVRLAELDAVMEAVLSPREHALFTTLPELLGKRFEQRQAQDAAQDWRGFQREVRNVQLAELDARFLPIDGLQAALQ